jgi:hypothetical protein
MSRCERLVGGPTTKFNIVSKTRDQLGKIATFYDAYDHDILGSVCERQTTDMAMGFRNYMRKSQDGGHRAGEGWNFGRI